MSQEQIKQLRAWMVEQKVDAFLVTQPQNRSYLSGWLNDDTEGAGSLLIDQTHQILLTNPLYQEAAQREAVGWEVIVPPSREYALVIASLAQKYSWQTIGFEAEAVTYAEYEQINTGPYTLRSFTPSYVNRLRLVKSAQEIALLKRAVEITDETFAHLCRWIQPGMTEKEVQWEIARVMASLGADGQAFEPVVAAGPNGSMPHAHASERQIERGELITIDMGARYKGYCADMTRTICLGEPSEPRMQEVYDAVLHAMKTCEQGLHADISGRDADALARNALKEAGLAEYYIHSTGHGVGLQIHEGPNLSARAPEDMLLPAGCVVTVEPGVYIPGWSGTRVEDCVVVTNDGVEVLTQSPTTLVIQR